MADISLHALGELVTDQSGSGPLIAVELIKHNTWLIDLDILCISLTLDDDWQQTKASDIEKRLSIARTYAQWGFVARAAERYNSLLPQIEGNTQDTILSREMGSIEVSAAHKEVVRFIVDILQRSLLRSLQSHSISVNQFLKSLAVFAKRIATLDRDIASGLWDTQADLCDEARELLRLSPVQRKQIKAAGERYSNLALRSRYLAKGVSNPWSSKK
jgi:hypothetical protein